MDYYADSSFLASCYITDANTPQAKAYLLRTSAPLVLTPLHTLEVRNAFKLGVFRGVLAAADASAAWKDLETDVRSGRLVKETRQVARRSPHRRAVERTTLRHDRDAQPGHSARGNCKGLAEPGICFIRQPATNPGRGGGIESRTVRIRQARAGLPLRVKPDDLESGIRKCIRQGSI